MVFVGFNLVVASNNFPQLTSAPTTDSTGENINSYLPCIANKYCDTEIVESPFSLEIAALHQITTTNSLNQNINIEKYFYTWYDQAFPTLVAALKDSGAEWTRIVIRWLDIEPTLSQPPEYDQNMLNWYDERLIQISQTGIKIIAIINSAPDWANDGDGQKCPAVTSNHLLEYQQFLTYIVSRYSKSPYNIHHWEIFNEADNTTVYRPDDNGCFGLYGSLYSQVLSMSYSTIKTIDPTATVLMSGIAYEAWTEPPYNGIFYRYFPDDVMGSGGASYFDALNFHYFPSYHLEWERWNPPAQPTCSRPPGDPGYTAYDGSGIDVSAKKNFFTNRMSACFNVDKPVWLTEMAEAGVPGDEGSLRNQAYYVMKGYSRGLAAGIKNITWFTLVSPPYDPWNQGLLNLDFSPKPAFFTYKTLVSQLTNYKYDRTLSISGGEAYVFRHSCNGETIVAWGNDVPITISPATSLEVTDYLGIVTQIQDGGPGDGDGSQNGSIQVMLFNDPMSGSSNVPGPVPIPVFIHRTSP
jgi:hypothetical protein